jgi:hypothetical protein
MHAIARLHTSLRQTFYPLVHPPSGYHVRAAKAKTFHSLQPAIKMPQPIANTTRWCSTNSGYMPYHDTSKIQQ